jgi:trans-aconitate methyltransferase
VVAASVEAVEAGLAGAGLDARQHSVVDVGSATGYTMLALLERGSFAAVHGVDVAPSMMSRCKAKLVEAGQLTVAQHCLHEAATLPSQFEPPLGAILANWTLHFIAQPSEREAYLQRAFELLPPGVGATAARVSPAAAAAGNLVPCCCWLFGPHAV